MREEMIMYENIYQDILKCVRINHDFFSTDVIIEKNHWIYLKEMSKLRNNMVAWLNIDKNMDLLELNAGCGINSSVLAEKAGYVTSLDEAIIKCKISREMNSACENLEVVCSGFSKFASVSEGKFDAVLLLGMVETYQKNRESYATMGNFLSDVRKVLKSNGHLYLATNNKYGLRYWAGCPEPFTGLYYAGIEGFDDQDERFAFSKKELKEILQNAGFARQRFFYPYPDYLFPSSVYSDEYLPQIGELFRNEYSFERERLITFDEGKVFDNLISDDQFREFSNSFFVVAQGE